MKKQNLIEHLLRIIEPAMNFLDFTMNYHDYAGADQPNYLAKQGMDFLAVKDWIKERGEFLDWLYFAEHEIMQNSDTQKDQKAVTGFQKTADEKKTIQNQEADGSGIVENSKENTLQRNSIENISQENSNENIPPDNSKENISAENSKKSIRKEIYYSIFRYRQRLESLMALDTDTSCTLNCGSVCCYIQSDMTAYGVLIESEKVGPIKDLLRGMDQDPADYMERVRWDTIPEMERSIIELAHNLDDYLFMEDGTDYVYHTLINEDWPIPVGLLHMAPPTVDNKKMWVGPYSLACMFLNGDNSCLLYQFSDKGNDLRPGVCRRFLCMLGYIIHLLIRLELLESYFVENKNIFELYKIAETCLVTLHDNVRHEGSLDKMEIEREMALRDVVDSYLKNKTDVNEKLKEFRLANEGYVNCTNKIRNEIHDKFIDMKLIKTNP